jgi:hypothetical protein
MSRHHPLFPIFLLILGTSLLITLPVQADSPPEAQQAYPYQVGFPRSGLASVSFASPSVVDLNHDGSWDILTADGNGCIWAWDYKGRALPGFPWKTLGSCSNAARINSPLAIGDIDNNGSLEVVAGTQGLSNLPGERGHVFIWRANGSFLPGWPKEMDWNAPYSGGNAEVYSVALANVSGNNQLEILAGTSNNSNGDDNSSLGTPFNLYAWYANGSLLPGYPTWNKTPGIFGKIGAADLTGDGYAEVITGRDHSYLYVYNAQGKTLPGWPVRTWVDPDKDKWNVDPYLAFTNNAPAMGDLDRDGVVEIVMAGKVRSPQYNHEVVNSGVLVLEPNGQRRPGWKMAKLGGGPLAGESFPPSQAPALADLDNDGKLEIVVALFDGTIRAYRENGALMWQYDYAQGKVLYGSEPAIGDITGDGKLDIIFGTYSPDGSTHDAARLIGLDANGQLLPNFPLPLTYEGNSPKQGLRAGPTLADIDRDCDVEILAASQAGVLYVWDLPAFHNRNKIPWPTSRHDNLRTGSVAGPLNSTISTQDASLNNHSYKLYLPTVFKVC